MFARSLQGAEEYLNFFFFLSFIHRQVITGNRSDTLRASPAERDNDQSDYMRNIVIRKVYNNKVCCEAP